MRFNFLEDLLIFLGVREIFPDQLGIFSFILVTFLFCLVFYVSYFLAMKVHELLFFKEERSDPKQITGKVKNKRIEHRKVMFKKAKTEKVFITVIATRKFGELNVEDEQIYKRLSKGDKVNIIYQKSYLVKRFDKEAKYLGLHIVEVAKRAY